MTDKTAPAKRPAEARPRGVWQVPSEAWHDEQVMDEFIAGVLEHWEKVTATPEDQDDVA